ncbi:hypothetical protein ACFQV4_38120 [Streptomyces thermocarboxydus]
MSDSRQAGGQQPPRPAGFHPGGGAWTTPCRRRHRRAGRRLRGHGRAAVLPRRAQPLTRAHPARGRRRHPRHRPPPGGARRRSGATATSLLIAALAPADGCSPAARHEEGEHHMTAHQPPRCRCASATAPTASPTSASTTPSPCSPTSATRASD